MKLKVRKNPMNTIELSEFLGVQVNEWTIHPDGRMELDLEVDELNPEEKRLLLDKLGQSLTHLVEDVE